MCSLQELVWPARPFNCNRTVCAVPIQTPDAQGAASHYQVFSCHRTFAHDVTAICNTLFLPLESCLFSLFVFSISSSWALPVPNTHLYTPARFSLLPSVGFLVITSSSPNYSSLRGFSSPRGPQSFSIVVTPRIKCKALKPYIENTLKYHESSFPHISKKWNPCHRAAPNPLWATCKVLAIFFRVSMVWNF